MLLLLGLTLLLSAFLLFLCEPMVGKMVLPILGGAAAVWTTCVLFFQLMLLAGYVYTHLLTRISQLKKQVWGHATFLLLALLFLPIHFAVSSGKAAAEAPVSWLLEHLLLAVGIPFLVVAATAPLLQYWLSRTPAAAGRDPYFLYAVSNTGSLLALLCYPLLIEPRFGVGLQSRLWTEGFILLIVLLGVSAALVLKDAAEWMPEAAGGEETPSIPPDMRTRLYWTVTAFVPSALMLAVTNHISLNIGSVPFIWVGPLAIYLLTFIMAFARKARLPLRIVSPAATIALLILFPIAAAAFPVKSSVVWLMMGAHILLLFAGALLCHTALADSRPAPRYLTEFYFVVALGGVLGGVFTAIIAPAVFNTVFEYPLLVAILAFFRTSKAEERLSWKDGVWWTVIAAALGATLYVIDWKQIDVTDDMKAAYIADGILVAVLMLTFRRYLRFAIGFAMLVITYAAVLPKHLEGATRIYVARDFFGVKKVLFDIDENSRKLLHGDTMHGVESLDPELSGQPLSYYHRTGPLGDVMAMLEDRPIQHVGVVGLGTGTIAAYGGPHRHITFFDVDYQVVTIANTLFTYLRRCGTNCDVIIGDGRLSIQNEPDHEFDLLVLDAFNSDSIPAHLVSREAVRMYMAKLKPDGVLLFHVSNRYLDVEKLAASVVSDEGFPAFVRYDDDEEPAGKSSSDYVAAVHQPANFDTIPNKDGWQAVDPSSGIRSWTDDYSNLMSIVRGIDSIRELFQ